MKALIEIRPVKRTAEPGLLERPGVTGIDVGYKYVKGQKTDELSIRVYVEKKKDVPAKERIPKEIQGVKTDVIQRRFVLHPLRIRLQDMEIKADTGTYDPLKGGISIGPCRAIGGYVYTGTLGAIVTDNATGNPMLLSNFHVMCVDNAWSAGDTMAQPSRVDGGHCPADVVGQLQRASLGGQVDCAVASHTARGHVCEIVDIGAVAGTAAATVGMAVRKRGRTTGLTYGTVDTIDLTVKVDYGDGLGEITLTNQIGIEVDTSQSAQIGDNGDSGSVVVDGSRRVVGLYFAGNEDGTYGVANPIQAVLDALGVALCVPKGKEFKEIEKKLEYEKFPEKKPEIKEFKDGIKEWKEKEFKDGIKEWKEPKEIKERAKEWKEPKEIVEYDKPPAGEGLVRPPDDRIRGRMPGTMDERLTHLEATVTQLAHFIGSGLRPDLGAGALRGEPDVAGPDLAALSRQLQKQAADAKQAKDSKDLEKPPER